MTHIPLWKRWWSYVDSIILETTQSPYNPYLQVCLRRGRLQLCTNNAIYSFSDLYDNFYKTFNLLRWEQSVIKEVLLLGFGLGSIPEMLEKNFKKDFNYTAIEIDPEIIRLAQRYVLPHLDSHIRVRCQDANDFVSNTVAQYELICVDIFQDALVPTNFEEDDFFENVKQLLTPNGLLLYNRLSLEADDLRDTIDFYKNHFVRHFPNATFIDTNGNWILVSDKRFVLVS